MDPRNTGLGGFRWLNFSQFGGALNDNFLKLAIIYALGTWWTGRDEKEILGLVGAAFAIPFLLFLGLGGNFADRYSKSKVAQYAKFLEVIVALGAVAAFFFQSIWGLFLVALMMSTQSALFSPAKYGIIPELVGNQGIARANGYIQAGTYLAIIGGTLLAPAISTISSRNYVFMAGIAFAVAVGGWVCSLGIPKTPSCGTGRRSSPLIIPDLIKTLKYIHSDGFLTLAVWGSAYFSFVAGFAQLNLLSYGTEHLLLENSEASTSLFLFIALGIGGGALLAGAVSRKSIEFGIVPIGALFLAGCSLGLGFLGRGEFWEAGILCFAMGIGAGLFIVPVDSFVQYRSDDSRRGEVVAAAGWLSWAGILAASVLVYILPKAGLGSADGFILVGVMVLALFILAMHQLPDFLVRFFVMILTRFYYKLHVGGQENLPTHEGALLVANHSSLMDAACMLAAQPRRIRFLMEREYILAASLPMRCLFRLMGVIPVGRKAGPRDIVRALGEARKALEEGWLVGIFPEGTLSRTGHMLDFRRGYRRIVRGTGAKIIPCYIDGAYGTGASYARGKPQPLSVGDFRKTIGLVFGSSVDGDIGEGDLRDHVRSLADKASWLSSQYDGGVAKRFVRSCRRHWARKAVGDSSGKTLTYGELASATVVVGSKLCDILGSGEKIVGILLPPSVAGVVFNTAAALAGKVSANLNYTSSEKALEACVESAGIKTVFTSRLFLEKTNVRISGVRWVFVEDVFGSIKWREKIGAFLMAKFLPVCILVSGEDWNPDSLLTVLFSSGSTAAPKGIMLSHRNICSNIDAFSSVARVEEGDCVLGVLPFFHSMGYTTTLWFPLIKGISACYHHHPLECDNIEKLCGQWRVSIVIGTPTFMLAWCRKINKEALGNLRWACAGAEKLKPRVADLFQKRFGIRPMEGYGTTECSPVVAVNVPDVDIDGVFQRGTKEGTAGRPLPNLICRTVDRETGEDLCGGEGIIMVKGPSVMLGYINNPEKTHEVLRDGWYNTGDIGSIDGDGFVSITDRLSRFSKIGGEMVSHTAVEEGIRTAAGAELSGGRIGIVVVGVEDERRGEKLAVLYEEGVGDIDRVRELVLSDGSMPNLWKPSPSCWVPVSQIPILGTGKVDLKAAKVVATEALANQ